MMRHGRYHDERTARDHDEMGGGAACEVLLIVITVSAIVGALVVLVALFMK